MLVMVNSATTGPFVGLFLMGLIFPWVNSKGAGTATLIMMALQFWLMYNKFLLEFRPLRIPVTLDNCPGNYSTLLTATSRATLTSTPVISQDVFIFLRLSSYWSNTVSTIFTILLGLIISALTGGLKTNRKMHHLTSDIFLKLWRWIKLIPPADVTVAISLDGPPFKRESPGFVRQEILNLINETQI